MSGSRARPVGSSGEDARRRGMGPFSYVPTPKRGRLSPLAMSFVTARGQPPSRLARKPIARAVPTSESSKGPTGADGHRHRAWPLGCRNAGCGWRSTIEASAWVDRGLSVGCAVQGVGRLATQLSTAGRRVPVIGAEGVEGGSRAAVGFPLLGKCDPDRFLNVAGASGSDQVKR